MGVSFLVYKVWTLSVYKFWTHNILSPFPSHTKHSRSFYHLDPRWQILTFFNDLALEGAGNLEQSDGIILEDKKFEIPFLLRVFARAGVFSVWRPTSNEAIRYMMTGEGVSEKIVWYTQPNFGILSHVCFPCCTSLITKTGWKGSWY